MKAYISYIKTILPLTLILLCAGACINYWLDPFQIYHDSKYNKDHFLNDQERYQNLGLIRIFWKERQCCDALILGTSHSQNFDGQKLGEIFKTKPVLNLSMSGSTPEEQRDLLNYAAAIRVPKTVFWELHTPFIRRVPPHERELDNRPEKKFPAFLYDDSLWNDYPYLLSGSNFMFARKQIFSKLDLYSHKEWYTPNKPSFNQAKRIYENNRDLHLQDIDADTTQDIDFYAVNEIILPAVKAYPDTKFIFYFPPYSLHSHATDPTDFYKKSMILRKTLTHVLTASKNARIYMFDDFLAGTDDLNNYKDIAHYHPDIAYAAMRSIENNKAILTKSNVDARLKKMTARINAYCKAHAKDCLTEQPK